ncbi:hypothetical protein EJ06DRAFT_223821 [Trichodelitschia bisporula]|uniref:Uncharacterized protein n=1 Tax=Trichodelitschia bisporula TaxID=703511 RepID=A0A6G1HL35_9PEZI|nr:hypothetical protein EJ06DRAFT_223821 [Trichodelitschia bisporula]
MKSMYQLLSVLALALFSHMCSAQLIAPNIFPPPSTTTLGSSTLQTVASAQNAPQMASPRQDCSAPYILGMPSPRPVQMRTCRQRQQFVRHTSWVNCGGCPAKTASPPLVTAASGFGGHFGPGPVVMQDCATVEAPVTVTEVLCMVPS